MATFLLVLAHGVGWDPARGIREQDGWDAHAAFMDALVDEGSVVVGGPVGDGTTTAHLVEAVDAAAVVTRLAQDPWARDGHLVVTLLHPWSLWLDGRRRPPDTVAHCSEASPSLH